MLGPEVEELKLSAYRSEQGVIDNAMPLTVSTEEPVVASSEVVPCMLLVPSVRSTYQLSQTQTCATTDLFDEIVSQYVFVTNEIVSQSACSNCYYRAILNVLHA